MTNETVSVLIEVARSYIDRNKQPPAHLLADLRDAALCDEGIDLGLRNQARQLLGLEGNAA